MFPADQPQDIGARNIERLLESAYKPEPIDPGFAAQLEEEMADLAQQLAAARTAASPARLRLIRRRLGWGMALAGAAAVAFLIGYAIALRPSPLSLDAAYAAALPRGDDGPAEHDLPSSWRVAPIQPPEAPPPVRRWTGDSSQGLTARPRPTPPDSKPSAIGARLSTGPGQRRRVLLPDGSVLFLNQQAAVILAAERRLELSAGEVYLEVAPGSEPFVVKTDHHQVSALGTRFAVEAQKHGSGVLVTQGQVQISGLQEALAAGQQLLPGADQAKPAPRASHLLDWTRDLMAAAESPLVPASKHAGGALVAVGLDGQEVSLELRKYHIDVHVEDGFARTTIDQTYFNHQHWQLEGTFYFPLPPDAVLSRLAMYVEEGKDCRLMEGGMAERDHARNVYETIRYTQRDPALLEWVDGSTFRMRVFPLEGRKEKRLILSYTQRLPALYGVTNYRFPGGHNMDHVADWSFAARVKNGQGLQVGSLTHPQLQAQGEGNDLVCSLAVKGAQPHADVALHYFPKQRPDPSRESTRFASHEHESHKYLLVRYRPALPAEVKRQRRDWVILFESAGNRDPLLARVQIDLVRGLLANAEADDTFTLLAAGTRVTKFDDQPRPVTPANIKQAVQFLEGTHLVGALDLGQALDAAKPFLEGAKNPHLLHVGAAIPALGEMRDDVNAKRQAKGVRYVGVAVGKKWNRAFMKLAAERSGGYFTQVNPDEPIGWRAFDLLATLNTPRLLDAKVTDEAGKLTFLADATTLAQGEELCAVARLDGNSQLPATVRITGQVDGQPFLRQLPIKDVAAGAGYLPRAWAKLEIDRLLADDAVKHQKAIVELSMASYVMSPYTSLLVLETDADYAKYKVDRGRKDHWAMYPCPDRIPIVYQPDPRWPGAKPPVKDKKLSAEEVLQTILVRQPFLDTDPAARILVHLKETFTGSLMFGKGFNSDAGLIGSSVFSERWALRPEPGLIPGKINLNTIGEWEVYFRLLAEDSQGGDVRNAPRGKKYSPLFAPLILDYDVRFLFDRSGHGKAPWDISEGKTAGPARWEFRAMDFAHKMVLENEFKARIALIRGKMWKRGLLESDNLTLADLLPGFEDHKMSLTVGTGNETPFGSSLLYERPTVAIDDSLFSDLTLFAPGLHTTEADIKGVLEAEGVPSANKGTVDPAARQLIDQARNAGWQTLTLPGQKPREKLRLVFNGQGHFRYERVLDSGLRETVLCDGQALYHLYAEIGLGSRRLVNRFHRAAFTDVVPWALPPADDLAHGFDVKALDVSAVAIIPLNAGKNSRHLHLLFAPDGRLKERRVVEMPGAKVLYRETYHGHGVVRFWKGDQELVVDKQLAVVAAQDPDLKPDLTKLVVLNLPLRTNAFWYGPTQNRDREKALWELAKACFQGKQEEALSIFTQNFQARKDRRVGLYTLLAAAGVRPGNKKDPFLSRDPESEQPAEAVLDVAAGRADDPLAQYLDHHFKMGQNPLRSLARIAGPKDGFVQRLSAFRDLWERWDSGRALAGSNYQRGLERRQALLFVQECPSPLFAWAIVDLVPPKLQEQSPEFYRAFLDGPGKDLPPLGLGYVGRYEYAKSLLKLNQTERARALFQKLHAGALKLGWLPPLDHHLSQAMVSDGGSPAYEAFLRQAGQQLARAKKAHSLLALAYQAQQTLDSAITDELLTLACTAAPASDHNFDLAALSCMWQTKRLARADVLLQKLLAQEALASQPGLWRWAAQLAQERGMTAKVVACLDRALDLDYRQLPDVVNLEDLRRDYRALLEKQESLALALATLGVDPQKELAAAVVRNADRWRALDPDNAEPCQLAAKVLQVLGAKELAWDYLTTLIGRRPNEADPWLELAKQFRDADQFELADRAFALAFQAEPTNAQILWDRAENLQRQGKIDQARQLYRQLADGPWQPRFEGLQRQARQMLQK